MSSGGPKLKSSHPCRNSAVDGLPSTTRAAAQTWSTTRETRIGDTRDRFEALSDTPRVPQPRRSSSGPGADRHDHSERSTRTAGAATRARVMMDMINQRHAGNPVVTPHHSFAIPRAPLIHRCPRTDISPLDASKWPGSRGPVRPEIVLVSRDRERRVEDRPPARRGLEGRRGARRTEPPNAAVKVGRCPSDRLPSALEPLENFRPVPSRPPGVGSFVKSRAATGLVLAATSSPRQLRL